jgi:peptidoglycan DL-endopeptidase CwlO
VDAGLTDLAASRHRSRRRCWRSVSVIALFVAAILLAGGGAASAAPGDPSQPPPGTDAADEDAGQPLTLRDALDVTAREYNEAKAVLDASKQRQVEIDAKLREAQERLAILADQVGVTANAAYRGSQFNLAAALLDKGTPGNLLNGVTTVTYLAWRDDHQLRLYNEVQKEYETQRKALDAEIRLQEEQTGLMEKRKNEAAAALAAAGGGGTVNGVPVPIPTAKPAPRGPNGKWPVESCTVDDPTTSGCITPRTMHALSEAKLAGFTRFVGCYRPGDRWEHPKGRACDFAASARGFGGRAAGGDKFYGDRLAGWCVANADRLGVLYVIWFEMIWHPGLGWKRYSGAGGSPSSAHTNHVHLSML